MRKFTEVVDKIEQIEKFKAIFY